MAREELAVAFKLRGITVVDRDEGGVGPQPSRELHRNESTAAGVPTLWPASGT